MFKSVMNVVILLAITIFTIACSNATQARTFTEGWKQSGVTSFYHRSLNGNLTANGERYRHFGDMTAAHRTLPFGTRIQVTDKDTGKSIVVRVNDRGPFHGNRVLDLSGKAAQNLGIIKKGVCNVEVKILSLPERYLAKTRPTLKPKPVSIPKVLPSLSNEVETELALLDAKPSVFPSNRIDPLEDLIARVLR